jgi:hypothetical protein
MPPSITAFSKPSVCILQKKNVRSWGELDEVAQVRIPALAPHPPCRQTTILSNYTTPTTHNISSTLRNEPDKLHRSFGP